MTTKVKFSPGDESTAEDICKFLFDENRRLEKENEKLKEFFDKVMELTIDHDVIDDTAVVYPKDLSQAMEIIKPEWWK